MTNKSNCRQLHFVVILGINCIQCVWYYGPRDYGLHTCEFICDHVSVAWRSFGANPKSFIEWGIVTAPSSLIWVTRHAELHLDLFQNIVKYILASKVYLFLFLSTTLVRLIMLWLESKSAGSIQRGVGPLCLWHPVHTYFIFNIHTHINKNL